MTTTKKRREALPRTAEELEDLATHYDTHDTSSEMESGQWVDPRPMKTTSLRLPVEVVEALKALAQTRGMRYTALVRAIVEQAVHGAWLGESEELAEINERLARIEAVVTGQAEEVRPRRRHRASASDSGQGLLPASQRRRGRSDVDGSAAR
jgi:predicted DNA-binding protein